jgi:pimeloyl-ACP methyl ester carboxylesterase
MHKRSNSPSLWTVVTAACCCISLAEQTSAAEKAPSGATALVEGIEMYYETSGQGEPLILLHGFGGSCRVWDPYLPNLAHHFQVIVPDLRGHGRSTNPLNEFTHRQSARDVSALLDRLDIRKVKAIGISTGGMTLLHVATREPNRIDAMILIGATIYFPEPARAIMRRSTVESLTPDDFERMRRVHLRGDDQVRALRRQFHAFKDSYDDVNFTRPYLSTITARTLIVHGDRDEFFPVAIPVEMYQSIPRAALWIVPEGGHVPIHDPTLPFLPKALDFLRQSTH